MTHAVRFVAVLVALVLCDVDGRTAWSRTVRALPLQVQSAGSQQVRPLSSGTRLGICEVTAKIDEGRMGEVYQIRDTTQCGARAYLRNAISAFLFTKGET